MTYKLIDHQGRVRGNYIRRCGGRIDLRCLFLEIAYSQFPKCLLYTSITGPYCQRGPRYLLHAAYSASWLVRKHLVVLILLAIPRRDLVTRRSRRGILTRPADTRVDQTSVVGTYTNNKERDTIHNTFQFFFQLFQPRLFPWILSRSP